MKLIKLLVLLVILLVVLAAAGVFAGFVMIDRLAAKGVEAGGSYALGVPTSLRGADVGVFEGTVQLEGLQVDNPEGFKADRFLTLGDGGLAVSLKTLREDVVQVPSLALTDIDVYLERGGEGKANYQVIIDNLKRFESGDKPPPKDEPGKRFVIGRVEIKDVTAHVSMLPAGLAELTTVDVVVPQIVLTDVGADKPLKLGELMNVITQAVLATIAANGGGVLPADFAADLQGQLANLDALRERGIDVAADFGKGLEQVAGSLEQIQGEVGKLQEQLEGVGEGLKGLLGGDKDDNGG